MEPTVKELRSQASKSPVSRLHFETLMWNFNPPTYAMWVNLVEDALHFEVTLMTERRNDLHDLDEDALSAVLNLTLQNLNLDASAEVINGNTDISIRYHTYRWLGEAKLGHDLSKIFKGYTQLTERYATGMDDQLSCGMLIYCTRGSAKDVMSGWQAAIKHDVEHSNISTGEWKLTFRSEDVCKATGAKLEILHIGLPLWHDPQDATKRLSAGAISAARKARSRARADDDDYDE